MLRRTAHFVSLLCLVPSLCAAQEAVWTDARTRSRAAEHAPLVREARAELDRAVAGRAAGARPPVGNPTVGVLFLPGVPDFGAWTTAVSVGLPLELSGVRGVWSREAEQGVLAARARLDDATLRAVTAARRARVELALARALVAVQDERLSTAREAERRVRARHDAGAATGIDVALSERETAVAEADRSTAALREVEALAAFRAALDLAPAEAVVVDAVARPEAPGGDVTRDTMLARAVQRRRDVTALDHDAERHGLTGSRAVRAAVAPLVVGFEAQQVATAPQELGASVGASLRWELPVLQRAQADVALADADARASRTAASLLRAQAARDVVRAAESLDRALAEVDALESRAIPAAERLVRATEAAHTAGALDYFRVLVARGELLQLRARALDALRTAWSARLDLERATPLEPR